MAVGAAVAGWVCVGVGGAVAVDGNTAMVGAALEGANYSGAGVPNLMELMNQVSGVDIAVGGHTHRGYQEPWIDPVNHTLCFETFGNGSSIGHVVLLVDRGSASASEVLAGALQDHGRALVVGERTFGKGSVQSVLPLRNGGAIKLTTARYYTPSGDSIHEVGIAPDVYVDDTPGHPDLSLSGALDIAGLIEAEPSRSPEMANVFGDLDTLRGSDNDLLALAERLDAPLVTLDRRLARNADVRCEFVLPPS